MEGDNVDFTVASFQWDSGTFHVDSVDGTMHKTLEIPNRKWRRACSNGGVVVAASDGGTTGASVLTSVGEEKQFIATEKGIRSCAISPDSGNLILGDDGGELSLKLLLSFILLI